MGNAKSVGAYTQHCLPLSVITDHSVPDLSPFFNRYIIGSLDLDFARSPRRTFIYTKLCQLILVGTISDSDPDDWRGTKVPEEGGQLRIRTGQRIPVQFLNYLNDKANQAAQSLSQMSDKQRSVTHASILENIDEYAASTMAKAMEADVRFSGSDAFGVTSPRDS